MTNSTLTMTTVTAGAAVPGLSPRYDPEKHLYELADQLGYEVLLERLPPRYLGLTHFAEKWVKIEPRTSHRELLSIMAHESVHLERGPFLHHDRAEEERVVEHIAARRLIELEGLIEAVKWSDSLQEVAEELYVRYRDVVVRLQGLTREEGERLDRALPSERRPRKWSGRRRA